MAEAFYNEPLDLKHNISLRSNCTHVPKTITKHEEESCP
jgi:hypothetical protein